MNIDFIPLFQFDNNITNYCQSTEHSLIYCKLIQLIHLHSPSLEMSAAKGFVFPGKTVEGSRKTDEDKELNFLRIQNRVQRRMILKLKNKNTKIKNSIDGKTFKLREEIVTLRKKTFILKNP